MRALSIVLSLVVLAGCATKQNSAEATPPASTNPAPPPTQGGIAPIGSGAAGGLTPVSGAESVDGAGMGGLGQSAKDAARRAAGSAGASSLGQAEGTGDQ